jgi:hypothetical protein
MCSCSNCGNIPEIGIDNDDVISRRTMSDTYNDTEFVSEDDDQRRTQGQSQTYERELRISNCNEYNALKILT